MDRVGQGEEVVGEVLCHHIGAQLHHGDRLSLPLIHIGPCLLYTSCTSGSSGIGQSASDLEALTDGATWLDGQRFNGSASQETVSQWVDSLSLGLDAA